MRPGQLTPTGFEPAILARIARDEPWLKGPFDQLHVLSREFTGVGSFTRFVCKGAGEATRQPGLRVLIQMPGVKHGMGAVLFCKGDLPECLEIYTHGDAHWDGVDTGFTFDPAGGPPN